MTQVFISYSRKDLAFVEHLAKDLKAAGLETWYDLSGLEIGAHWGQEIQAAIQKSQYLIIVLSPYSIVSEWVEREFIYASNHKLKIFPLIYKPCDLPLWSVNLHCIDMQGRNYKRHFGELLQVLGVEPRQEISAAESQAAAAARLADEEKNRQEEQTRQKSIAEEKQRNETEERLRRAAEAKFQQEQLARQKNAAEEKARLEAEERLRQKEELQVRRAALELEKSRQATQKRELQAAEIARLQQEIQTSLDGQQWERARLLLSQLKEQGPEGQALAGSLSKGLPGRRIPGWAWAFLAVLAIIALLGFWARGNPGFARLTPTFTPTNITPYISTAIPIATTANTSTPTPGGPVSITFWSPVFNIQDQVDEWNAQNPNIQVNYVNPGNDTTGYTKLDTALQYKTNVPDVITIGYDHLPGYIAQAALADLTEYGANSVKSQFIPWAWAQVSQGSAVYAFPQDGGPLVMFCNDAALKKNNIPVPTTWAEFASSATVLHNLEPSAYLSNFTTDPAWFFSLLWQSGAHPFIVNGRNVTINFTSPEVTRVARLWGDMMRAGVLSPVETYSNDWITALGTGSVACWPGGGWGTYISVSAPNYKGQISLYQIPQWTAGGQENGNYGGAGIAVSRASAHPAEAEKFAQWLTTDPRPTLELTNAQKAIIFPVALGVLSNPAWLRDTEPYWSGQPIRQVMSDAAQAVTADFAWSPFTDFVNTSFTAMLVKVQSGALTPDEAMDQLQAAVSSYAIHQGYTVTTP